MNLAGTSTRPTVEDDDDDVGDAPSQPIKRKISEKFKRNCKPRNNKPKKQYQMTTIKSKLKKIAPRQDMQLLIDQTVVQTTVIMHYASVIANIYLRDIMLDHNAIDATIGLQMLYTTILNSMVTYGRKCSCRKEQYINLKEAAIAIRDQILPGSFEPFDFEGFSDIIMDLGLQMETCALNHIHDYWETALLKWCRRKVKLHNSKSEDKLSKSFPKRLRLNILIGRDLPQLELMDAQVQERVAYFKSLINRKAQLKEKWQWELLLMYEFLKDIENDNALSQNRKFKRFRLLPTFTLKSHHLNLTISTLKCLCSRLDIAPDWELCFPKIHSVLKSKYSFADNLRTDGVALSLTVFNEKKPIVPKRRTTKVQKICFGNPAARLVSIDPGIRSVVTGVVGHAHKPEEIVKMTSGEYHHLKRSRVFNIWMKKKVTTALHDNFLQYRDYCSSETSHLSVFSSDIIAHYRRIACYEEALSTFYQGHQFMNRRFSMYKHKQRTLDELMNRITMGQSNKKKKRTVDPNGVTVAIGNYSGSHIFGSVSVPNKGLKKKLAQRPGVTVVLVDEFLTSKVCSNCHHRFCSESDMRQCIKVHSNSYAIRLCQECTQNSGSDHTAVTSTVWNRDVNSALNMRTIFYSMRRGDERPAAFQRSARHVDLSTPRLSTEPLVAENTEMYGNDPIGEY